jgi:predicted acylesterase/phospholipase RssA
VNGVAAIPQWEVIWVCARPGMTAPLEALTRLLADAAARQFEGMTAIVLPATSEYVMWVGGAFTPPATLALPIGGSTFDVNSFYRIFVVNPVDPTVLPPAFTTAFDRIVYLTDEPPVAVPPALAARLKTGAISATDPSQTYFSSFIPSVVLDGPALPPPRSDLPPIGSVLSAVVRDAFGLVPAPVRALLGIPPDDDGFQSEPLDDQVTLTAGGITASPRAPLERDTCRLRFDLADVERLWNDAQSTGTVQVFHQAARAAHGTTADRWARAVTNRRVGMAISGSGATSYRMVPVLQDLDHKAVPVDVFGGISGGAALGAYYCRDGQTGLTRYTRAGNRLSLASLLFAAATSQPMESGIDWAFHETTLDDLEVRFVPVTTALPEDGPPEAHAVVRGTLGAAVRASGAFPLFFARTVKHGIVYADGAMSAQIPARALPDYGADYVFACNSVPGPDSRNPLHRWPGGELLYRFTWVGRLLDAFVSGEFLFQRIGREAGEWAHEFIEMSPNGTSILEIFRWDQAGTLVARGRKDGRAKEGVVRCQQFWQGVRIDP